MMSCDAIEKKLRDLVERDGVFGITLHANTEELNWLWNRAMQADGPGTSELVRMRDSYNRGFEDGKIRGVAAEREACAKVAEECFLEDEPRKAGKYLAKAIRSRGK